MRKKLFLALLSVLLFAGVILANNTGLINLLLTASINNIEITVIEIKGHEYIITNDTEKGGICTIHSESCSCRTFKK